MAAKATGTVTSAPLLEPVLPRGIGADPPPGGAILDPDTIYAATTICYGIANSFDYAASGSIVGSGAGKVDPSSNGQGHTTAVPGSASTGSASTALAGDAQPVASGDSIDNDGVITSAKPFGYAVGIASGAGYVHNTGTIEETGFGGLGVSLADGGNVANAAAAALIAGYYTGIGIYGGAGSVTNAGTIEGTGSYGAAIEINGFAGMVMNTGTIAAAGYGGIGIYLTSGGSIDNALLIDSAGSYGYAIEIGGAAGSVYNTGTIEAPAYMGIAVSLAEGGLVDNAVSGALITGYYTGIGIYGAPGTVTNAGTIAAANGDGIDLAAGGTVVDAGTIGGNPAAIYFGGTGGNLLELEKGYSLSGSVVGSGRASNTLELSSTLGAVTVRYDGLGLVNFGFVDFAPPGGRDETLLIADTAVLPGTIEGFTAFHDVIDLRQLTADPTGAVFIFDSSTDKLTVTEGTQSVTLQLAGNYSAIHWVSASDGHGGTDLEPACFARGTMILTENGEHPVEALSIGDRVVTFCGKARPIKWVGRRSYKGAFLLRHSDMWPIRVAAGALAPAVPRRHLYLSAHHALFLDGLLIPVECLVNGGSITRCDCPDEIAYFHIELESHDVIMAEGAAAETFVDCGNRGIFHNACEFALLYPAEEARRQGFWAPRVEAGGELEAVRRRLRAREHGGLRFAEARRRQAR